MGQGTTRVVEGNGSSVRVRELGDEITDVRRRLDTLVMELDRRRHNATDWRRQLRLHGRAIAAGVLVVVVAVATPIALARVQSRRRSALMERGSLLARKARQLGQAVERIADNPDRVAPTTVRAASLNLGSRTAVAVAAVLAQTLARSILRAVVTQSGR